MQENEVTQQQNSNEAPKDKTPNSTGHPTKQPPHANAKKTGEPKSTKW
ncbi:hypothetical protein [Sulfurospirillum diekertiae]|nr:hypothetical protein [Sulfurospirillum diekertiae]